jgi:hypothetical protein
MRYSIRAHTSCDFAKPLHRLTFLYRVRKFEIAASNFKNRLCFGSRKLLPASGLGLLFQAATWFK